MLTQTALKALYHYSPRTGLFTRRVTLSSGALKGEVANVHDEVGYVRVVIKGERYRLHRLAFLYMEGGIPTHVDHKNGVRDDNRWCNLRAATATINSENIRKPKRNGTSGYLGVSQVAGGKRFFSRIRVNNKCRHLGCFDTPEEAHKAYIKAKRKFHAGCTI